MTDRTRSDGSVPGSAARATRYADRDDGWTLAAELLTATFLWGGVGWLADRWLDTAPVLMVLGFVLGNALGVYLIWVRSQDRFTREHADLMARRARTRTPVPGVVPTVEETTPSSAATSAPVDGAPTTDHAVELPVDDDEIVAPIYEGDRID